MRLNEIDDQIQRWSTALHDFERRESQVRTELASERAFDGVSRPTSADRRGAVAVIEDLVKELQGEIVRLKRSASSQTCVCSEIQVRLQPLVGHLDQQVTRLAQLTEEHERAVRSHELHDEAKHLARSQTQIRDQLDHLHRQRQTLLCRPRGQHPIGGVRASDLLAQLTDGHYVQIKLVSGGRRALVVDRHAQTHSVESLSVVEQQLVALSLSLAIISGLAKAGLQPPVILDEPFFQMNERQACVLAKVLHDFSDHQIFVFTRCQSAVEQFRALGAAIHDLDNLPRENDQPSVYLPHAESESSDAANAKPALRIKRDGFDKPSGSKRDSGKQATSKRKGAKRPLPLKFSLDLQSPIDEFTTIPAELAEELAAVGIRQIHDLLKVDASKLADLLESEIDPVEIVTWQHQARLCCRIPNLKTRDACILVNCGFSTPEDIASMKPAELFDFIQSFASTEEGQAILGDGGKPELDTVKNWIRAARHSRVLGAA